MKNFIKQNHKFNLMYRLREFYSRIFYRIKCYYYDRLKPIFNPQHSRLRKAIPKQWRDITSLILEVNFEFVKSFYEDEYIEGYIDWSATEGHQEFATWLEQAYGYITKERLELEKAQEAAYPPLLPWDQLFEPYADERGVELVKFKDDGIPYDVKYGEVTRLENLIKEKDTTLLTELIKHREYFWT